MIRAATVAAALMLASCREPAQFEAAKNAAAAEFAYPGSAEFRNLRLSDGHDAVCGEVRGRLVDGEMTDFRRFRWTPSIGVTVEGLRGPSGLDADFDRTMAGVEDTLVSLGCT